MTEEIQKQAEQKTTLDIVGSKDSLKNVMTQPDFQESLKLVAGKYMTPERIVKAALLALSRQPKLLNCTKASFLQATIKAAESGLDFGGQTGQAFLVPYWNGKIKKMECQFQAGYQGYIEAAYRSGKVDYIDAQLVYEKDKCDYQLGSNPVVKHKPYLGADRGKVLFGYTVTYLAGCKTPKIEIMSDTELEGIKARTKSRNKDGEIVGPWVTDEGEMKRKTLIRRMWKYLPKTPEMQAVLEADNEEFDLNIRTEELLPDKSNLGANGLKKRLKVESKEITKKPATTTNTKPTTTNEVNKHSEEKFGTVTGYHCEHCIKDYKETDDLEEKEDGWYCSECGYKVTPIYESET